MPENILWRAQRPFLTHIYTHMRAHIQNNNKEKNKNRDISHYPPKYIAGGSGRKSTIMLVYYENMEGRGKKPWPVVLLFFPSPSVRPFEYSPSFPCSPIDVRARCGVVDHRRTSVGGKRQNRFGAQKPRSPLLYPKAQLYTLIIYSDSLPPAHVPFLPPLFSSCPQISGHIIFTAQIIYVPHYINWTLAALSGFYACYSSSAVTVVSRHE